MKRAAPSGKLSASAPGWRCSFARCRHVQKVSASVRSSSSNRRERDVGVVRLLFHQCARGHENRGGDVRGGDAVVHVVHRFFDDGDPRRLAQALTGFRMTWCGCAQHPTVRWCRRSDDVDGRVVRGSTGSLVGPGSAPVFTVQHVRRVHLCARRNASARVPPDPARLRCAACRRTAGGGEDFDTWPANAVDQLANARRGRGGAALDREKALVMRDGNLDRLCKVRRCRCV